METFISERDRYYVEADIAYEDGLSDCCHEPVFKELLVCSGCRLYCEIVEE